MPTTSTAGVCRDRSYRLGRVLSRFRDGVRPRLWWEFADGHRERIVAARRIARDVVRVQTETHGEFSVSVERKVFTRGQTT